MKLLKRLLRSKSEYLSPREMRDLKATAVPVYESETLPFGGELAALGHGYPGSFADPELPCAGCAHSASGAPFPGFPSGERPCAFCVRNPNADPSVLHPAGGFSGETEFGRKASKAGPNDGIWYGGTPAFKTPMDCYIATDRITQQRIFDELDRLKTTGKEAPERQSFPAIEHPDNEVWCCEGGPAPGGHTWTCWGWLGISFG